MRRLLILGAGTAGTMVANKLRRELGDDDWSIDVVDRDDDHHYQPGYLFVPFGGQPVSTLVRSRREQLRAGIGFVEADVDLVLPETNEVRLTDGRTLGYDYLVIASGCSPRPEETPGMLGPQWRRSIFDFYTPAGATALADALPRLTSGRLVVHVAEMPVKCPVAPLEFTFLADAWLRTRGLREAVEITYVTPLPGAFTQPVAAQALGAMLSDRGVTVEADFAVERIDPDRKVVVSYDEREVPFDLLVTVPVNMGADFVDRSGLGDELHYVPVDKHTLRSVAHPTIFALGDASDVPTSKAGSSAHYAADIFCANFLELAQDRPMTHSYDGHANCFIETGDRRGLLIDFNYDVEPLPGRYPLPLVGPLSLLKPTRANHLGKLAFEWVYWHVLMPGRPLPLPDHLTMAGKRPATTS